MINKESKITALVPARAGSKGILNKNIAITGGLPLIAWTLNTVANSTTEFRLVVTTDSRSIAEVALNFGAEIVDRPAELARDESPTEPALIHALESLGAGFSDIVVLLQPTSPVRLPGTLDRALAEFTSEQFDSLVGVVEESPFLWTGDSSHPAPQYAVDSRPRRQDFDSVERFYRETGSLYIFRYGPMAAVANRIHGRVGLFVLDDREGLDIDTPYDLAIADCMLRREGVVKS